MIQSPSLSLSIKILTDTFFLYLSRVDCLSLKKNDAVKIIFTNWKSRGLNSLHFCLLLSLSFSLFAIAPLWRVRRSLSLSLSLSISLSECTCTFVCARGLSAPIKKDIRGIRISTREVSVSEGGTLKKYFLKNWFALCLKWCRSIATPKTDGV